MLYLISSFTGIFFSYCIIIEYIRIKKQDKINIITFVNLMYGLIYGFVPTVQYLRLASGDTTIFTGMIKFSIENAIVLFIASVIGYFWLNLGYNSILRRKGKRGFKSKRKFIAVNNNTVIYLMISLMFIGIIALLLWTRAYGGITQFMKKASLIRSGYGDLNNEYAFFKHFAKLVNISAIILCSYAFFSLYSSKRVYKKRRLWVFAIISFVFAFLFLLTSDSRGNFGQVIIVIFLSVLTYRAKSRGIRSIKLMKQFIFVLFIGLLLTASASLLANSFRFQNDLSLSLNTNVFETLVGEFRFTLSSQHKMMEVIFSSEYKLKLLDDVLGSLIAWLPNSLKPFPDPVTLWSYNTSLVSPPSGTIPTDIITASVYLFGPLGILFLPFFVGKFARIVDRKIELISSPEFSTTIKYVMSLKIAFMISHYQFRSIIYENFYLVIALVVIYITSSKTRQINQQISEEFL